MVRAPAPFGRGACLDSPVSLILGELSDGPFTLHALRSLRPDHVPTDGRLVPLAPALCPHQPQSPLFIRARSDHPVRECAVNHIPADNALPSAAPPATRLRIGLAMFPPVVPVGPL
jgi:hypothetical protein